MKRKIFLNYVIKEEINMAVKYTNSKLISYTKLSPNYNPRNGREIKKITIHHMAGNLTVEQCGNIFASSSRQASSNYGIGTDGRIAMYVEEKNRSWCSSSSSNDYQAITIEVANCKGAPNWEVSDKAMKSLISLCVDICKRNNIKELNFTGNANGNLTQHNYFAATACPGPYLKSKFSYIAKEVNKKLKASTTTTTTTAKKKSNVEIAKEVLAGKWGNGEERKKKLKAAGYDYDAVQKEVAKLKATNTITPAKKKSNAEIAKEVLQGKWGNGDERKKKLKAAGYNYEAVQKEVEKLLAPATPKKKSNAEIAKEVLAGKWGNGDERKKKLKAAGYDYNAVQKEVNKLLSK
jgi:hypothetical protein